MIQNQLIGLREIVLQDDVTSLAQSSSMFGGADIKIVHTRPKPKPENSFYDEPQFVVTKYAKELSWLIFQLKDVFSSELNYMNKYEFYSRLAERANKSIEIHGEDLSRMFQDVLDDAEDMAKRN
ncbi:MAG: hypothetical protein Q4F57_06715 [Weeksellaceae bacterium]|nr:hypothetical protein [Weeksellaceae bacterium]